jgi:6-phosphogluconolactonase
LSDNHRVRNRGHNRTSVALLSTCAALFSSCGGGSGGNAAPPTYSIGGTIQGLRGAGLVLQNNGGGNLSVPAGASSFQFPGSATSGTAYDVTVLASPLGPPAQTCIAQNGSGTVSNSNPHISVTCATVASELLIGVDANGTIYAFPIDPDTGSLRAASVTVTAGATALATDPSGKFVYTASLSASTVSGYTVTSAGGLQSIPGSPFPAPGAPDGLVIEPSGHYLYASTAPGFLGYSVDSADGVLTPIAGSPFPPPPFTPDPAIPAGPVSCQAGCAATTSALVATTFYGVPSYTLAAFTIDSTTGALTGTSTSTLPDADAASEDLVIDRSGNFLYVTGSDPGLLQYKLDSANANVTLINDLDTPTITFGVMTTEPSGKYLYASASVNDADQVLLEQFSIDPATGLLTTVPTAPLIRQPPHAITLVVEHSGKFLYAVSGATVYGYSIDDTTGQLTQLTNSPFTISATLTAVSTALIPQ